MPWYRGEVVTDEFLQGLWNAYRNCNRYADAGDAIIRDRLESAGVTSTAEACSLGSRDEADVAAHLNAGVGESSAKIAVQTATIPGGFQGGQAPATPDVVYTSPQPQGQVIMTAGSPMQAPSDATSGPAGAFGGWTTQTGASAYQGGVAMPAGPGGAPAPGGFNWTWILLLVAAGVGIYFVTKKG